MKRLMVFLLALALLALGGAFAEGTEAGGLQRDVLVLFTSDVHCGIDQNFGYAGLQAIRDAAIAAGNHVLLVDNGDAIQGEPLGTLTRGEVDIELMNAMGYDIIASLPVETRAYSATRSRLGSFGRYGMMVTVFSILGWLLSRGGLWPSPGCNGILQ